MEEFFYSCVLALMAFLPIFLVDVSSEESSSEDVQGTFLYLKKQAELRNR